MIHVTREILVMEARTWLGTPFQHQGRLKWVGVDCVGLIVGVARTLELPMADHKGYNEYFPDPEAMQKAVAQELVEVVRPTPGCVILLDVRTDVPLHLAILAWDTIIHVWGRRGVVEHSFTDSWKRKLRASYQYRGLTWLP